MPPLTLDQPVADDPTKPLAPKPVAPLSQPYGSPPAAPATGTPAPSAPLATEYPSAPSTTGTPQNRLQLATNAFDTFAKSTAPQYAADLRLATQTAAGKGQVGSGGLRTTYGNLANQRALALDTQRDNLINAATTGTIADQQAADANAIGRYNADTSRLGTTGNLDVAKGSLDLAKTHEATSSGQTQQQIDLAKKQADVQNAIAAAGLTGIYNGAQTVAAKSQAIQDAVAQGRLTVEQAQLALSQLTERDQATNAASTLKLQQQAQDAQEKYQTGQLTLAQRDQALRELAQADGKTLEEEKLSLAKDQLAQSATQFGLSQAQQLQLATLADKTQNRQLDISSAQGQNQLLVQLAAILGGPSGVVPKEFLAAVSKALGITTPTQTTTPTTGTPGGPGTTPYPTFDPTTIGSGSTGSPYGS